MAATEKDRGKFDYQESLKKPSSAFINKIGFVDTYLNRPLASLVVRAVFNTRLTPNGLSYSSFVLGLLGAFFFSRGQYIYFILGGVFAQLSSIVDGADGMLARAKNICSDYGAHLDLFLDRIMDFSLFVCMSVGVSTSSHAPHILFLGTLGAGLYLLQTNLFYLTKSYLQVKETGETGKARAVLYLLVLVFALINRLDIFLYLGLAETTIVNLVRLIHFINLGRKRVS